MKTLLVLLLAGIAIAFFVYGAVMVDTALRGYQDSPDWVYLTAAGIGFALSAPFAALAFVLWRIGAPHNG